MGRDRYTALQKAEEFVTVTDGNRQYYGGDQDWFSSFSKRYAGCGIVAAANLTAYLEHKDGKTNTYTKEQFLLHMEETARYVRLWTLPVITRHSDQKVVLRAGGTSNPPRFGWAIGVWPAGRFIRGVLRYMKNGGERPESQRADQAALRPLRFHWNRFANSKANLDRAVRWIRSALEADCPPVLLIGLAGKLKGIRVELPGGGGWDQVSFSLHWVVVTALLETEEGVPRIRVSTWGGSAWLPLPACFDTGILSSSLCCFLREES